MISSSSSSAAAADPYHTDDDDDDRTSTQSQFQSEDAEAFYYDSPPTAGLRAPPADAGNHAAAQQQQQQQQQQPSDFPVSNHSQFTLHTPLPTTTGYVDPFIAVKEMLWLLPNINDIVLKTLERMEKAFAYNSVYFLKVILDLQSMYLPMRPSPPPAVMLKADVVVKLAGVLSGRLKKKESDGTSLSRELQLRTLISALSLLYQLDVGKLNIDAYSKLLRDVTERDAENEARQVKGGTDSFKTGGNEFLTRYACDLVRCLPNDLPPIFKEDLSQEAVHVLFAAGFISHADGACMETLNAVFARLSAPPSHWHKHMRHLYEGTAAAICLHHQSKSSNPPKAAKIARFLAGDVARSIVDLLGQELGAFMKTGQPGSNGSAYPDEFDVNRSGPPQHDAQMFICGLLDLLAQLVSTFPAEDGIVREAKVLALGLVRNSDSRAFRYKAFEIIICSTLGVGEREYYDTMRNLELEIEETSKARGPFDSRSEQEKRDCLHRIEQLKIEKREAMDRCEKKNVLSTGAAESMQRRLQGNPSAGKPPSFDEIVHTRTPWSAEETRTTSSVPSNLPSQCPTLSSAGQSWETASTDSLTPTRTNHEPPTRIQYSNVDYSPCKSLYNSTDADEWQTVHSPTSVASFNYSEESPVVPISSTKTFTRRKLPEDPTPPYSPDMGLYNRMSQLFAAGLSFFAEPEDYDQAMILEAAKARKMALERSSRIFLSDNTFNNRKPTNQPVQTHDLPFRRSSNHSSDTLDSIGSDFGSQVIDESSPLSTYPEPSLTRMSSAQSSTVGTLRRQSRALRTRRTWSLQLDKPLPSVVDAESMQSIAAENAPEPVVVLPRAEPVMRSQSVSEVRDQMSQARPPHGLWTPQQSRFTPLPPIADIGAEDIPQSFGVQVEYDAEPVETAYKFHSKDSCFSTFISEDAKYAVFLSPHSFQVFAIPAPEQAPQLKPKFHYRLGDWESLKKSKVPWTYKSAAVSDRYVVTITRERLQVHDLADECNVIYNDSIKGWEYSSVDIAADKLVVGLSKALKGENIGMIRIYQMNPHTFDGHRYKTCGRDIHLPIHPKQPQDAPNILTLSRDGNFVTCGTPRFGYYFAWALSPDGNHEHIMFSQLKRPEGPDSETLTGVTLFPDARHILCSTFSKSSELGGCFTEAMYCGPNGTPSQRLIRQVSLRITHSAVSPVGTACAFLSKHGSIWVTPTVLVEGDENLTSLAAVSSRDRLQIQNSPDGSGKIAFSPTGERLVGVDRKGKVLVLQWPVSEVAPTQPLWAMKTDVGGYF